MSARPTPTRRRSRRESTLALLAAELSSVQAEASHLEDQAQAALNSGAAAVRARARELFESAAKRYWRKRELLALIRAGGEAQPISYDAALASGSEAWSRV